MPTNLSRHNRTNAKAKMETGFVLSVPTTIMPSGIYVSYFFIQGNRCHLQYKIDNDRMMDAIGKENYGENSFPSALFLTLGSKESR